VTGKVPKGESELWSFISQYTGMHCPLYKHCQVRQKGGWCPSDNHQHLDELLSDRQFNLQNFAFIKPLTCGTYCSRVFEKLENLAARHIKEGNVNRLPVPSELITLFDKQRPIEIHLLPLKVHHGALWSLKDRWLIQLNDNDDPRIRRFTLFHEAFHILFHCRTHLVFKGSRIQRSSFREMLADCFAAYILMPGDWVQEKWAEVKDLEMTASIFGVTRQTMCIRLKLLGLI
jgi:hypothetical protein